MGSTTPDPFDPDSLRLPPEMVGRIRRRRRPPRHRAGEPFLRGPIPFSWWAAACRLPGHALHVASAVRFRAGWCGPGEIKLGLSDLEGEMGVGRKTARRGLAELGNAGLVSVAYAVGSKPVVSIMEGPPSAEVRPDRAPLRGPIPWAWWTSAARLPGRSLQVASALWLVVGWHRGREAEFTFGLADWPDLGLSRFSADRGLRALEGAGLVSVTRSDGRKAVVKVQEVGGNGAGPDGDASNDSILAPRDLEARAHVCPRIFRMRADG